MPFSIAHSLTFAAVNNMSEITEKQETSLKKKVALEALYLAMPFVGTVEIVARACFSLLYVLNSNSERAKGQLYNVGKTALAAYVLTPAFVYRNFRQMVDPQEFEAEQKAFQESLHKPSERT